MQVKLSPWETVGFRAFAYICAFVDCEVKYGNSG